MNGLIIATVIIVLLSITAIVFIRVTKAPGSESPKRRELRRANVRAITAERTMNDLEGIINRYRPVLDDVESALVHDITERISKYKDKILEIDQ